MGQEPQGSAVEDTGAFIYCGYLIQIRLRLRFGLHLIHHYRLIQYLQVIKYAGGDNTQRPDLAITNNLLGLIDIARRLGVPILVLSQFNRDCDGFSEPKMSQLKESSSIEQLADAVLLLHRPPDKPDSAELILAKNREGPVGREFLTLDPNTTLFKSNSYAMAGTR